MFVILQARSRERKGRGKTRELSAFRAVCLKKIAAFFAEKVIFGRNTGL